MLALAHSLIFPTAPSQHLPKHPSYSFPAPALFPSNLEPALSCLPDAPRHSPQHPPKRLPFSCTRLQRLQRHTHPLRPRSTCRRPQRGVGGCRRRRWREDAQHQLPSHAVVVACCELDHRGDSVVSMVVFFPWSLLSLRVNTACCKLAQCPPWGENAQHQLPS